MYSRLLASNGWSAPAAWRASSPSRERRCPAGVPLQLETAQIGSRSVEHLLGRRGVERPLRLREALVHGPARHHDQPVSLLQGAEGERLIQGAVQPAGLQAEAEAQAGLAP